MVDPDSWCRLTLLLVMTGHKKEKSFRLSPDRSCVLYLFLERGKKKRKTRINETFPRGLASTPKGKKREGGGMRRVHVLF